MAAINRKRFSPSPLWSLAERIEFATIPEPNSGCLLWLGNATTAGYPLIGLNGELLYAHRIVWEDANGPIPNGMFVCHKCDVPLCINLDHLFLGTHQDNVADRDAKNRVAHGIRAGNVHLTEEQVRAIRADTRSSRQLAAIYPVNARQIRRIRQGIRWRRLG